MKKRLLALLLALCCLPAGALAEAPYAGYIYNAWAESVPAPINYLPESARDGMALCGKNFKNPDDVYVSPAGNVYVSDTGNDRVVVLSADLTHLRTVEEIALPDGGSMPLKAPAGIFVDEAENLFIALPKEGRVVMLDESGLLQAEYVRPDSDLLDDNVIFSPTAVLCNRLGTVFVLVDGLYLGALCYQKDGRFLGFYGSNEVVATVALLTDRLWKSLLSQEQASKMTRYVPVQFSGFDLDKDQFIYTCTNELGSTWGEIKKLNSLGDNVLVPYTANVASATNDWGDLERALYMGQSVDSKFVDIAVRDDGMIFALDRNQGRIFEYDGEGRLLGVFGASGSQLGAFTSVQAVDTLGGDVLVLDGVTGMLTRFVPTAYGALIEGAVALYNDGRYQEAMEKWQQVLEHNVNCELAYVAIGKALYEQGEYREAMDCFQKGYDRVSYSRAYQEYRVEIARQYAPPVLTAAAALLLAGLVIRRIVKRRKQA